MKTEDIRPGSPVKGVLVGAAIDIGGSLFLGGVVVLIYSFILGMQGHSPEEIQELLSSLSPWSTIGIISSVLGLLLSVIAGYQCAAIARRNNYRAPGILALVSMAFAGVLSREMYTVGESIGMAASTALAILGGAWMCHRWRTAEISDRSSL
ncbi:MAG TPA: hypothetical protein DHV59_05010 [Oxalobacteraceae bacterium]|nr:hypothetical protein [Oxalobacteraceae bacterium]